MLCRTRKALEQHLAAVAARLDGRPGQATDAADCQVVQVPTSITVIAQDGPGRTEIRLAGAPRGTGWTDTYLPTTDAAR